MNFERRKLQSETTNQTLFDAVIIGGGINGASVYRDLCRRGLNVLLLDKGDFASGTSQSSSMMIWGGLIHMRQLRFDSVWRLCKYRDDLIREFRNVVQPQRCMFLQRVEVSRKQWISFAGLASYWMFGMNRVRPRLTTSYSERSLIKESRFRPGIEYEEGTVFPSDARVILDWILESQSEKQLALNYCELHGGKFDKQDKTWKLELNDRILGNEMIVSSRFVINAAGPWVDKINSVMSIDTPLKHAFGKGVAINFNRDVRHRMPLMIETPIYRDCMSLIPWGPVSIWGPTETRVQSIEKGFKPEPEDVNYLLEQASSHFETTMKSSDVVSVRCGVRPLAVEKTFPDGADTLGVSRRHLIHPDDHFPWISIFGGKITSSIRLAASIGTKVEQYLATISSKRVPGENYQIRDGGGSSDNGHLEETVNGKWSKFPGSEDRVISPEWSADREMCWSLEDYLRRRTNLSQWLPRCGLGSNDEHRPHLTMIARAFTTDENEACRMVDDYSRSVVAGFDHLIADCS